MSSRKDNQQESFDTFCRENDIIDNDEKEQIYKEAQNLQEIFDIYCRENDIIDNDEKERILQSTVLFSNIEILDMNIKETYLKYMKSIINFVPKKHKLQAIRDIEKFAFFISEKTKKKVEILYESNEELKGNVGT